MTTSESYSTITLTFSECVENHIGNQQIGEIAEHGFSCDFLLSLSETLPNTVYHDLSYDGNEAAILIMKECVDKLLHTGASDELLIEQGNLATDKKYWDRRRKQVLNKRARHNLCFADFDQEPSYIFGKGTVIDFDTQPILSSLRQELNNITGHMLYAEGNYYHRLGHTGIGFHGDTERRMVVGVRLGDSMPLVYRWYLRNKFIDIEHSFALDHGDIYIMSEKATGFDWRKSSIHTLRHAAGTSKYTKKEIINIRSDTNTKVKNPLTGRMISINGKLYQSLVKDGIIRPEL